MKSDASGSTSAPVRHYRKPGDPISESPSGEIESTALKEWEATECLLIFALMTFLLPLTVVSIFHDWGKCFAGFGNALRLLGDLIFLFFGFVYWCYASKKLFAIIMSAIRNRRPTRFS